MDLPLREMTARRCAFAVRLSNSSALDDPTLDSRVAEADHPRMRQPTRVRPVSRHVLASLAALGVLAAAPQPASPPAVDRVRVPARHANVHMGPNTTTAVLVLAPRDTVLTVLARDKEWVQVRLTPELRKTGLVMRWYKNEDRGWMHDSTVATVAARD